MPLDDLGYGQRIAAAAQSQRRLGALADVYDPLEASVVELVWSGDGPEIDALAAHRDLGLVGLLALQCGQPAPGRGEGGLRAVLVDGDRQRFVEDRRLAEDP